jgi:hypothetical protein
MTAITIYNFDQPWKKRKMSLHRFPIFAILLCLALTSAPLMAGPETTAWQMEATALYDNGDFAKARKAYLKLGKKGDRFSAYRVSYMSLKGQGTREDVIESFAWAVVAAEDGPTDLVDYRDAVAALVPEDDRDKARQKAVYYMRRWGPDEIQESRSPSSGCTSSRLASACNPSSSSPRWIAWGANAGEKQELIEQIEVLNQSIVNNPGHLEPGTSEG